MTTPPAATSVRIANRDYPFPHGCGYFTKEGDNIGFGYRDNEHWINKSIDTRLLPIIAAVAARHFRNKARDSFAEALICCDLDKKKNLMLCEMDYIGAAEQWEELCNQL